MKFEYAYNVFYGNHSGVGGGCDNHGKATSEMIAHITYHVHHGNHVTYAAITTQCAKCNGSGTVTTQRTRQYRGSWRKIDTCPDCKGKHTPETTVYIDKQNPLPEWLYKNL